MYSIDWLSSMLVAYTLQLSILELKKKMPDCFKFSSLIEYILAWHT